jgi:hypothetical protein
MVTGMKAWFISYILDANSVTRLIGYLKAKKLLSCECKNCSTDQKVAPLCPCWRFEAMHKIGCSTWCLHGGQDWIPACME